MLMALHLYVTLVNSFQKIELSRENHGGPLPCDCPNSQLFDLEVKVIRRGLGSFQTKFIARTDFGVQHQFESFQLLVSTSFLALASLGAWSPSPTLSL